MTMDIASTDVSFPVLQFESTVIHQTPRVATAFEWMMLRVHERLAGDARWNGIPISRIFSEILAVPDPNPVISPMLDNLAVLGIFQVGERTAVLGNATLRDLNRTERGNRMLRDRLLPAVPGEEAVKHSFDPVRSIFIDASEQQQLDGKPMPIHISEEPFLSVYPREEISERLRREGHRWLRPDTRIESVTRKTVKTAWMRTRLTFRIEQGDVLELHCRDEARNGYLSGLSHEYLAEQLVRPFFFDGKEAADSLPPGDAAEIEKAGGRFFPLKELRARAQLENGLRIIQDQAGILPVPDMAPARTLIAVFGDPSAPAEGSISWNENGDGATVRCGSPFSVPGFVYWNGNGACLGAQAFDVRLGNGRMSLPLCFTVPAGYIRQALQDVKGSLETMLASSGELRNVIITALWKDEEAVWKEIFKELAASGGPFEVSVAEATRLKSLYMKLVGRKPSAWDKGIETLFLAHLEKYPGIVPNEKMSKAAQILADCGFKDSGKAAEFAKTALARMKPPETLEEMGRAFEALAPLGLAAVSAFPSPLYTKPVLEELFRRFPEKGYEKLLLRDNRLERALKRLKSLEVELRRAIGGARLEDLAGDEACQAALRTANLNDVKKESSEWARLMADLRDMTPGMDEAIEACAIGRIHSGLEALVRFSGLVIAGVEPRFKAVFIVDTCALIDRPDLPFGFRSDELIVVSKRVIEELDDKKKDTAVGSKASVAIRVLKGSKAGNIRYEEGELRLLPGEYRNKGDNWILSIALKYRPCRPVLVTDDNALALKAKAEGIISWKLAEFDERRNAGGNGKNLKAGLPSVKKSPESPGNPKHIKRR